MALSLSLVLIIFLFYFIPPVLLAENDMFIYFELNFLIHFLRKLLQRRKEKKWELFCPKVGTLILTAPNEIFSNGTKTLIFKYCKSTAKSQICCSANVLVKFAEACQNTFHMKKVSYHLMQRI